MFSKLRVPFLNAAGCPGAAHKGAVLVIDLDRCGAFAVPGGVRNDGADAVVSLRQPVKSHVLYSHVRADRVRSIVIRPGKGVLVLNVFDEDMNSCMFDDGAFLVNGIPSASPLARAFGYRDSIIQQPV